MNAFFTPKKNKYKYAIWLLYYLFQLSISLTNIILPLFLIILNVIFICFLGIVSYKENIKKLFIFPILICVIWMLVEILLNMIFEILHFSGDVEGFAGSFISNIIMFVFSILADHYAKRKFLRDISLQYKLTLLFIPIGSIYIIHNVFVIVEEMIQYKMFTLISCVILLFINYIIFEVYDKLNENAEMQEMNLLYEQQLELCTQHATERELSNKEVIKLRHDMNNHLACLLGIMQDQDIPATLLYIKNLLKTNSSYKLKNISRSGNIVVDSLVNYKYTLAHKENISFNANIFVPITLPFQSGHLSVILGNLLENALNACRQIKHGERFINLNLAYEKGIFSIVIENTYYGSPNQSGNELFLSIKKERANNELGLASVIRAVEQYHGTILINYNHNIFQVTALMYDEQQ